MIKLRRITVQGFRSFGVEPQVLDFDSEIGAIWGPNSQGKTSLSEAIEFLFTGSTVRRAMTASSQDEFADALRNAHLPVDTAVFVEATIDIGSGKSTTIRRQLDEDYSKKQNCISTLEIDGKQSDESDLARIGIGLSEPPLAAPVLMQHTLGYLFSAKPQERSLYFKALLEVSDLDVIRSEIERAVNGFDVDSDPIIGKLERCARVECLSDSLSPLLKVTKKKPDVRNSLVGAALHLLGGEVAAVPENLDECTATIRKLLVARRAQTFPIHGLKLEHAAEWTRPDEDTWSCLSDFIAQTKKIETETQKLVSLYEQALAIPELADASGSVDCPVCGTEKALTPLRIEYLRSSLKKSKEFRSSRSKAESAMRQLLASVQRLEKLAKACPAYFAWLADEQNEQGFSVEKMRSLLPDSESGAIDEWEAAGKRYRESQTRLLPALDGLTSKVNKHCENIRTFDNYDALRGAFDELAQIGAELSGNRVAYSSCCDPLYATLRKLADENSATAGWEDFVDIASAPELTAQAIHDYRAKQLTLKDCSRAIREIDKAKAAVFNDRFKELSDGIASWWEMLRRDEPSYFERVSLRKGGKRNIDFKAGLANSDDRSDVKLRDVISVFSYSQLHCLGLAAFLARAVQEQPGFVVLDDPVQSSDEDHRAPFTHEVIDGLVQSGLQVIVLTQNHGMWQDVNYTYGHKQADIFQLTLQNPRTGTQVVKTSDDLQVMLSRVEPYVKSKSPDILKDAAIKLRDAAERFCKEMLVRDRKSNGDDKATVSDYVNKNLKELRPAVEPLFTNNDHAGRFRSVVRWLNKGDHDTTPPNAGEVKSSFEYLRQLKKEYL